MDMTNIKLSFSRNVDQPLFIQNVKTIHIHFANFNARTAATFLFVLLVWHLKHKGHNFEEVAEVYKAKKEVIEKDAEELVNLISTS